MSIAQLLLVDGIAQPIYVSAKSADADHIIDLGDGLRLTFGPGIVIEGDNYTVTYDDSGTSTRTPRRYPGDGNRHERRKAAAGRRRGR